MTFLREQIVFGEDNNWYRSYINDNGNIFIGEDDDDSDNFCVINKEDWEDFKNFIDKQFFEEKK